MRGRFRDLLRRSLTICRSPGIAVRHRSAIGLSKPNRSEPTGPAVRLSADYGGDDGSVSVATLLECVFDGDVAERRTCLAKLEKANPPFTSRIGSIPLVDPICALQLWRASPSVSGAIVGAHSILIDELRIVTKRKGQRSLRRLDEFALRQAAIRADAGLVSFLTG